MAGVTSEGVGLPDFTQDVWISGVATISGSIVGISGEILVSGAVSIIGGYNKIKTGVKIITGRSGGAVLGETSDTSGYNLHMVTIKALEVKTSGTTNNGLLLNSGLTTPYVYIGGVSGDRPYPGSGFVCSGKGYALAPGESIVYHIDSLEMLWLASEQSGNAVTYSYELR